MKAVNIRNISLSACLGIFSFHIYVVNTYSVGLKQSDNLKVTYSRNIAQEATSGEYHRAGDLSCKTDNINLANLRDDSTNLETCEVKIYSAYDAEADSVTLTLYLGLGTQRTSESVTIENVILPLSVSENARIQAQYERKDEDAVQAAVTDALNKAALAQTEVQTAQDALVADHLDRLITEIYEAAEPTTTDAPAETVVVDDTADSTDGRPPISPLATAGGADTEDTEDSSDDDLSVESINAMFKKLKDLQENSCMLANADALDEIVNIREIKKLLKKKEDDWGRFGSSDFRFLTSTDRESLLQLEAELEDFDDEESSDLDTQITCLSQMAKKENSDEKQLLYYLENIRPLVISSGSLDSNIQEDGANLQILFQNEQFKSLQEGPQNMIAQVVEAEKAFAGKFAECSQKTDAVQIKSCTDEFKAELSRISELSTSNPNDELVKSAGFAIGMDWLSKLTGTPVSEIDLNSTGVNSILDPVLSPGSQEGALINGTNLQDIVLENVRRLNNSTRAAAPGSSARGRRRAFVPVTNSSGEGQHTINSLDTSVTPEDLARGIQ